MGTLGCLLSWRLLATPPPTGNLNGTDFALLLFGSDQTTPLLTPDGVLARIAVSAEGAVLPEAFPPGSVSAGVLEPATVSLLISGLLIAIPLFRKSR